MGRPEGGAAELLPLPSPQRVERWRLWPRGSRRVQSLVHQPVAHRHAWRAATLQIRVSHSHDFFLINSQAPTVWLQTRCVYAMWPFGFGFADLVIMRITVLKFEGSSALLCSSHSRRWREQYACHQRARILSTISEIVLPEQWQDHGQRARRVQPSPTPSLRATCRWTPNAENAGTVHDSANATGTQEQRTPS